MNPIPPLTFMSKKFMELTTQELYAILKLRSEVFVVEQNCAYQDIDAQDQKAIHIIGYYQDEIIAYARIFKQGDCFTEASIGRVLLKKSARGCGHGHKLIEFSIESIENKFNTTNIRISAQKYLTDFYQAHNFCPVGEIYLEDGIEHIAMLK